MVDSLAILVDSLAIVGYLVIEYNYHTIMVGSLAYYLKLFVTWHLEGGHSLCLVHWLLSG